MYGAILLLHILAATIWTGGHLVLAIDIAGVPGRQFGGSPLEPDDALVGYDGAEFDYINSPGFLGVSVVVPGHEIEAALECGFGGGTLAQYRNVQTRRLENRQSPQWRLFRSIAAERLPTANMYEFSLTFVLAIMIMYVLFERMYNIRQLGAIVLPIAFGMTVYIWSLPTGMREITPLIPALQSRPIMTAHVSAAKPVFAS